MKIIKLIPMAAFFGIAAFGMNTGYSMIADDFALYQTESDCVAQYIKLGIPRAKIKTGAGTCELEL